MQEFWHRHRSQVFSLLQFTIDWANLMCTVARALIPELFLRTSLVRQMWLKAVQCQSVPTSSRMVSFPFIGDWSKSLCVERARFWNSIKLMLWETPSLSSLALGERYLSHFSFDKLSLVSSVGFILFVRFCLWTRIHASLDKEGNSKANPGGTTLQMPTNIYYSILERASGILTSCLQLPADILDEVEWFFELAMRWINSRSISCATSLGHENWELAVWKIFKTTQAKHKTPLRSVAINSRRYRRLMVFSQSVVWPSQGHSFLFHSPPLQTCLRFPLNSQLGVVTPLPESPNSSIWWVRCCHHEDAGQSIIDGKKLVCLPVTSCVAVCARHG